jgi:hypothetical protein
VRDDIAGFIAAMRTGSVPAGRTTLRSSSITVRSAMVPSVVSSRTACGDDSGFHDEPPDLVDRAEKRGLLQRAPNPADGRAVDVFLTAEGMQLAAVGAGQVARSLSPMTGKLTRAEARRLTTLLECLLEQEGP